MPKVSVIIPCYNQGRFLGDAVESALKQTLDDLEVIVVDDGSSDDTAKVVESFTDPRIRFIRQANLGAGAARNTGFRASTGTYVNFLDADDYLSPHKLARQAAALDADPSIALAFCDIAHVDAGGKPAGNYSVKSAFRPFSNDLLALLLAGGFVPPHAFLIRRDVIDAVGLFDDTGAVAGCEDYDLWLRVAASGHRAFYVDEKDVFYRIHGSNMSLRPGLMDLGRREALRRVANRFPDRIGAGLAALQDVNRELFEGIRFVEHALELKEEELGRARAEAKEQAASASERISELTTWTGRQDAHITSLWEQTQELQKHLEDSAAARATAEQLARDSAARAAVLEQELRQRSADRLPDRRAEQLKRQVKDLEEQVKRLWQREQKLRTELDQAWASERILSSQVHDRRLSTRARRALHRSLDAVQRVTPESARSLVRPVYLKLYRRIFPQGKRDLVASLPPSLAAAGGAAAGPFAPVPPQPQTAATEPARERTVGSRSPLVSVVLPVWNHSRFLADSIASVLGQTHSNLELIVVDDGSEEDIQSLVRSFPDRRLRCIRKPHSGIARTLNEGFRHARGEFLTWTSADNRMQPEMIATLLDFLLRRPEVDMAYGDMELMDAAGAPLPGSDYRIPCQRPEATHKLRLPHTVETLGAIDDNFIGACFLYRRRIAHVAGDYDAALLGTEDYDYWLRINELGTIRHVDTGECLYRYGVHADTLSARSGAEEIHANAGRLIEFHRARTAFYRSPFAVVLLAEPAGAVPFATVIELAREFRAQGHFVTLVTPDREAQPPGERVQHIHCGFDDGAKLAARIAAGLGEAKGVVVSFVQDPQFLPALARALTSDSVLYCDWVPAGTDAVGRLQFFPRDKMLWALCASARTAARLPESVARNWSLLIPSGPGFNEAVTLARKARDNNYPLWDVPDLRQPLVLYLGPVSESVLDFDAIRRAAAHNRGRTFLFIDTGGGGLDPRHYCPGARNVHWAGAKAIREWHQYLSRAALLIAPFRNTTALEGVMQETLSVYLAAGKPVLATDAIAAAGFEDMPNLLVCAPADFGIVLEQALDIRPDWAAADAYLRTRSLAAAVRTITGAANSRLHLLKTRPVASESVDVARPGPQTASILIETRTLNRGGLERVVANTALALRERGFRVAIAITEQDGDIADECRAAGITVYFLGRDAGAFRQCIRIERPDILISNYSTAGAPVAAEHGIPVIDVVHNSYVWTGPVEDEAIRANGRFITKYVAVSEPARRFFAVKYGVDPSRITTVPNGVDAGKLLKDAGQPPRVTRDTLGIAADAYVFLQAASFFGTKAQAHSVSAMSRIARKHPNAWLLLVGSKADAAYSEFVEQQVVRLGVSDRVLICGETDRITDYYRLADAFLLSSLIEGWSLAMTEAMLFGLPMILTAVGAAEQVVEGEDIGIVVPAAYREPLEIGASRLWSLCTNPEPANLSALVAAMERFCEAPAMWRERGKRGTEKVLRDYTAAASAKRLIELISQTLQQARAAHA